MLDRLTLHAHFLRMLIETSLHRLDHVLMLHRAMRRSGPVLHCDLSGHLEHTVGLVVPQILAVLFTQ